MFLFSDFHREILKKLNQVLYEVRKIDDRLVNVENLLVLKTTPTQLLSEEDDMVFDTVFPLSLLDELSGFEDRLNRYADIYKKCVSAFLNFL